MPSPKCKPKITDAVSQALNDPDMSILAIHGCLVCNTLSHFTRYPLVAAKFAANIAQGIETKYKTERPPQDEFDLYLSQISAAIICSVVAMESHINEYIIGNTKTLDKPCFVPLPALLKKYNLGKKNKKKITLKELFESTSVLLKYDTVFSILNNRLITIPHSTLIQDITHIVKLRNLLVHFTPEYSDALDQHANIKKKNHNLRFPINPFSNSTTRFPYFLSAKCAMVSHMRSEEFIKLFNSHC
ncbi:MAG: hypothetical protein HZC48_01540 [Nitrospirae bacterium]|nr:hypothetical protein [Nitrospirota bacterium]